MRGGGTVNYLNIFKWTMFTHTGEETDFVLFLVLAFIFIININKSIRNKESAKKRSFFFSIGIKRAPETP